MCEYDFFFFKLNYENSNELSFLSASVFFKFPSVIALHLINRSFILTEIFILPFLLPIRKNISMPFGNTTFFCNRNDLIFMFLRFLFRWVTDVLLLNKIHGIEHTILNGQSTSQ